MCYSDMKDYITFLFFSLMSLLKKKTYQQRETENLF